MTATSVTTRANVTAKPRKCIIPTCTTLLIGYRSDAKTCSAACRKAYSRSLKAPENQPACTLTAPAIVETFDLGNGSYRVRFDDGRAVTVKGASPAAARTRARFAVAKRVSS